MTKYAIYSSRPVKGNFKKLSDFFKTADEAIEMMNSCYNAKTKVMAINTKTKEKSVVAYHKDCYK